MRTDREVFDFAYVMAQSEVSRMVNTIGKFCNWDEGVLANAYTYALREYNSYVRDTYNPQHSEVARLRGIYMAIGKARAQAVSINYNRQHRFRF